MIKEKDIIDLIPFKVEMISSSKIRLLSELQLGEIFRENNSKFNYFYYYVSHTIKKDLSYFINLASSNYNGKICNQFGNPFTSRDKIPEVYSPAIFRQISGKHKGKLLWFPYLDAWKEHASYDKIKLDMQTKGNEKRYFLPNYLNETFYKKIEICTV